MNNDTTHTVFKFQAAPAKFKSKTAGGRDCRSAAVEQVSIVNKLQTAAKMVNLYRSMAAAERNNREALIEVRRLERCWTSRLIIFKRKYEKERRQRLRALAAF